MIWLLTEHIGWQMLVRVNISDIDNNDISTIIKYYIFNFCND